ncbi:4'-phosphopantetheinyl transferase family protein [Paenibacillus aquistagni]|uniref:4'-phosphopantetheinyl transferase family protein n=1 Tax=Paenibacillus aquistagni TaxID=1852522 RepID=UPI00145B79BC|nr:4'-phosphopantetheinyl transferase superfamily protein [Paenibacillus aquistagni]NMM51079.1 4'-phosphopantetheinyl transferase superfamily protein [Paenibacillus aquistagni]
MIYYFESLDLFTEEICMQHLSRLPQDRQLKVHRYKHWIDKKMSIVTYLLLAYGMKQEYSITEPLRFGYRSNQKPYLLDFPHIYFNISHCEECVAVAISDQEIGIDVQNMVPYDPNVAAMVCSPEELEQLRSSSDPEALFIRYWTLKESYLKMTGSGITDHMSKLDFSSPVDASFYQYNCYFLQYRQPRYWMSICSLESPLHIHNLSLIDLC